MNILRAIGNFLFPAPTDVKPRWQSVFRDAITIAKTLGEHEWNVLFNNEYVHRFGDVVITYEYDAPFRDNDCWYQRVVIAYGEHGIVFDAKRSYFKGNGCKVYRAGRWIDEVMSEGLKASEKLMDEQSQNFDDLPKNTNADTWQDIIDSPDRYGPPYLIDEDMP